jgi:hypothetical protein
VILNASSVLAAFAAILRVSVGLILVAVGARAILRRRRCPEGDDEGRFYLLFTLAATLLGLAVVSWPLLYVVLQSYVPRWPGVMCILGVTRIGTGSQGPASHLPGLLAALEATKPALVFLGGAWLVLHLAHRRAATGALAGRVLAAILACGLLAVADGAAEIAYLVIPKKETFLAAGCCLSVTDRSTASMGAGLDVVPPAAGHAGASAAFFLLGGALVAALSAGIRRLGTARGPGPWLPLALAGAAASLPVGFLFLSAVAVPAFLRVAYHDCPYCLLSSAPESILGIACYLLGVFAVGWASIARFLGTPPGAGAAASPCLPLLRLARFGYLGALLMAGVRLAW